MRTSLIFLAAAASISTFSCILQPRSTTTPSAQSPDQNGTLASATAHPDPLPHPSPPAKKQPPLAGFMRGMNLGNALDAPKEGEWGVTLEPTHFEAYEKAGFDHVRLPVRMSAHAAASAPFAIDPSFFSRVDWAIDQAQKHHLGIIIDVHHYEGLIKEPDTHTDQFLGIWKQIAERYKNRPKSVAFELINEPNGNLQPDKLNKILNLAIKRIRATNPDRIIIVDPYFWASAEHLKELDIPTDDPNLVATFHCYNPILYTHQGSPFMPPEYQTTGIVFPGPPPKPVKPVAAALKIDWVRAWFEGYNSAPAAENPGGPKAILDYFDQAQAYFEKTGLRLYMGEFAANDKSDMPSRARWTRFVREEAERRGYGWAYWDDGGSMKAFKLASADWIEPLRDALLR